MSLHPEQCPHCALDLHTMASQHLAFCPRCQFPVKTLAGKYRIEWKLATGGFGVVYFATSLQTNNSVVVKLVKRELFETPEAGIRFQREIMITEALSSTNEHIVRYLDHGEDSELGHFYVMEYLDGISLDEFLNDRDTIPYTDCFHIFRQICEALAIAHRQGVVHRDLKPENIFLIRYEDDPLFVKVLDFGIAKIIAGTTQASLTHGIIGTPNYLSPEQCLDGAIDGRSDIYAMGVILYELLTRTALFTFEGDSMMSLLFRHINEIPTPMRDKRPDLNIPEELDQVVLRALAKAPQDRYQTIGDFWAALRPFAFLPIQAHVTQEPKKTSTKSKSPARQETAKAYEPTVDFLGRGRRGSDSEVALPTPKRELRQAPFLHESAQAAKSPGQGAPKILSKAPRKVGDQDISARKEPHRVQQKANQNLSLYVIIIVSLLLLIGALLWFRMYHKDHTLAQSQTNPNTESLVSLDGGNSKVGNPPPVLLPDLDSRNHQAKRQNPDAAADAEDTDEDESDEAPPKQASSPRKQPKPVKTSPQTQHRTKPRYVRRNKPVHTVGPCGQNTATVSWVWAQVSRPQASSIKIVFYACPSCRAKRQGRGYCLSIPATLPRVRLRIKAEGYQSCLISVSTQQPRLLWTLRVFDPDALIDASYPCSSALP